MTDALDTAILEELELGPCDSVGILASSWYLATPVFHRIGWAEGWTETRLSLDELAELEFERELGNVKRLEAPDSDAYVRCRLRVFGSKTRCGRRVKGYRIDGKEVGEGTSLPARHAIKFAVPCKKCWGGDGLRTYAAQGVWR